MIRPAIGWWLLVHAEGIPATLGAAIKANLMGFLCDFVVPSAYLGGEPLKMVYIAHTCHVTTQWVLATVIVAQCQECGGLVLRTAIAAPVWRGGTVVLTGNTVPLTLALCLKRST